MPQLSDQEKLFLRLMAKKKYETIKKKKNPSVLSDMFNQAKTYGSGVSRNTVSSPIGQTTLKTGEAIGKHAKGVGKKLTKKAQAQAKSKVIDPVATKGKKLTKKAKDKLKDKILDPLFMKDYKGKKRSKNFQEKLKKWKEAKGQSNDYQDWLKDNQANKDKPPRPNFKKQRDDLRKQRTYGSVNMNYKRKV